MYSILGKKHDFEYNDIGIIKVDQPFQQTRTVTPIKPTDNPDYYPEGKKSYPERFPWVIILF